MFSPFALRFDGYSFPLSGVEERYVKSVLNHPGIVEWIEAGKRETEVIESEEIVT
jgi:glutathione S-transferase